MAITPLAIAVDSVDRLICQNQTDPDTAAVLLRCRDALAALAWERFRIRHEVLSRQATAQHIRETFKSRHQGGLPR